MTWKDFGGVMALITLGNVVAYLWSEEVELWLYALVAVGAVVAYWVSYRLWNRRMERLEQADPATLARELRSLSDEDHTAARLALGLVSSDDAVVDALEGERFEVVVMSESLRQAMIWGCLGMAGLVVVLEWMGQSPADSPTTTLIMAVFFLSCGVVFERLPGWSGGAILVTNSGIVQVKPNGDRIGILWSEVAEVRNRTLLTCLDVTAADGRRRVRVSYSVTDFARVMELLVANLAWMGERLGRSPHEEDEESTE